MGKWAGGESIALFSRHLLQILITIGKLPGIQEADADDVGHFLPVDFAEFIGWLVVIGVHGRHEIEIRYSLLCKRRVVATAAETL